MVDELWDQEIMDARRPIPPSLSRSGTPRLEDVAFAAIAATVPLNDCSKATEILLRNRADALRGSHWHDALEDALRQPAPEDEELVRISRDLGLTLAEQLLVALAVAVEENPLAGRILAHVQNPVGGSRPTLGLAARAFSGVSGETLDIFALARGPAIETGMLSILNEAAPLPERTVRVPEAICFGLRKRDYLPAGISLPDSTTVALPESVKVEARRQGSALAVEPESALVLRSGCAAEARAVAAEIARSRGSRAVYIHADQIDGLGPWLRLRTSLPVFCFALGPGEHRQLQMIPGYDGPVLAVCGPEGAVENPRGMVPGWKLSVPCRSDRLSLWADAVGPGEVAVELSSEHRHSAGRIAELARLARHHATLAGRCLPERQDISNASWLGEGAGLETLAEPVRARVSDEALVLPASVREELDSLRLRCRLRDELAEGLGASCQTRYRPGVRALFTGPSGTGKTLAAAWLATTLGVPLYRVDLASVTSKYIGETEKNLAQLLARAEESEVILLFDEADSLFGKRTDVRDSNDRFANAQTNYLLQRIENYDGIVVLTSNSQVRFDGAFARRLDFIIDFPLPGAVERKALWLSHLGEASHVSVEELNQLSALVDVSGGHIRNAVLGAAARARNQRRPISTGDLIAALRGELRKLGRQLPVELARKPGEAG